MYLLYASALPDLPDLLAYPVLATTPAEAAGTLYHCCIMFSYLLAVLVRSALCSPRYMPVSTGSSLPIAAADASLKLLALTKQRVRGT